MIEARGLRLPRPSHPPDEDEEVVHLHPEGAQERAVPPGVHHAHPGTQTNTEDIGPPQER